MRLSVLFSAVVLLVLIGTGAAPARAQSLPSGYVSLFADAFPNRDDTVEWRSRLFVEKTLEPSPSIRLTLSGFAEGLVARRPVAGTGRRVETGGILRVHDANIQIVGKQIELLAGYARVTWGMLDEIQPTDVINPLDVSRFFFEGRSEARLPVLLVRGRIDLLESVRFEGVYVPDFRRGRSDQLAESSSPFNITTNVGADLVACLATGCPTLPLTVVERQPAFTWRNAQGGARFSATTRRVDWSVSAYRGFESFGFLALGATPSSVAPLPSPKPGLRGELDTFVPSLALQARLAARGANQPAFDRRCIPRGGVAPPSNTPGILGRRALPRGRLAGLGATADLHRGLLEYPRFTMLGADFEAVRGEWGVRGELAAFVDDSFQSPDFRIVSGSSIDAGIGVDRRAGHYTLSGTVLVHSEFYDTPLAVADPQNGRSDVSVVVSADRTFARERYRFRGFGVYNATESSGFVRGIGLANLRDNVALEASIGWFAGDGSDLVGRFGDSDFVYMRVKYYF